MAFRFSLRSPSRYPARFSADSSPSSPSIYSRSIREARFFGTAVLIGIALTLGACDSSPTEPCPQPVDVQGHIVPPLRIAGDQPQYTVQAREARIQGVVILQLQIDCTGVVTNITPIKELPLGLTEAAITAVRTWRYRPATLNGQPISVFYNITINFRIQ